MIARRGRWQRFLHIDLGRFRDYLGYSFIACLRAAEKVDYLLTLGFRIVPAVFVAHRDEPVNPFDEVRRISGQIPLVIDSREFLLNPRAMLEAICDRFNIEFSDKMLLWPPGPRASDGIWARYWYDSVWRSTGFARYCERSYDLDNQGRNIAQQARPYYEGLYQFRLQA